jgi:hypothetical protein
VYDPHPDSREQRAFLFLALALLPIHATLLLAGRPLSAVSLLSNLIQLFCALAAAAACVSASRRTKHFAKHFWLLFAAGCALWGAAQIIATYYDSILHVGLEQPWPSDVIFFLAMAPLSMTLFIDKERGFDWKQWPRIFELLQVIILLLAAYFFTFETPTAWKQGWAGAQAMASWVPDTARDLILLVAFTLAAAWGRYKAARALYGRLAIFLFAYIFGEIPYLYLQSRLRVQTGSAWISRKPIHGPAFSPFSPGGMCCRSGSQRL